MTPMEQSRRAADRIRDELLLTLEEVDRRRHRALSVRYQLRVHLGWWVVGVGTLVLTVGGGVWLARLRQKSRRARAARERVRAFIRAWEHPRRVATRAPYRPLPAELARRWALAFASGLAAQLARRAVARLPE
ncbi:MAG: hypothetical protein ACOZIN_05565 [Myxococcota bacterium]